MKNARGVLPWETLPDSGENKRIVVIMREGFAELVIRKWTTEEKEIQVQGQGSGCCLQEEAEWLATGPQPQVGKRFKCNLRPHLALFSRLYL
jgi:hypothetical protein